MYVGEDFPDTTPSEQRFLSFDFSDGLSPGETVVSSVWTVGIAASSEGSDPSPMSRLLGSPTTDGFKCTQQISGCLSGVTYLIDCVATTSSSGKLDFSSHIYCGTPA